MSEQRVNDNRSGSRSGAKIVWLKDRYPNIADMHYEDETAYEPTPAQEAAAVFSDAGSLAANPMTAFDPAPEAETPSRDTEKAWKQSQTTDTPSADAFFQAEPERSPFARPGTPEADPDMEIVYEADTFEPAPVKQAEADTREAAPQTVASVVTKKVYNDPEIKIPLGLKHVFLGLVLFLSAGMIVANTSLIFLTDRPFMTDAKLNPYAIYYNIQIGYLGAFERACYSIAILSGLVFVVLLITRRVKFTAFYPILMTAVFIVLFLVSNDYHKQKKKMLVENDNYILDIQGRGYWSEYYDDAVSSEEMDEMSLVAMQENMNLWILMAATFAMFACVLFYQLKQKIIFLWINLASGIGAAIGGMRLFDNVSFIDSKYVTINLGVYGLLVLLGAYAFRRKNRVKMPAQEQPAA